MVRLLTAKNKLAAEGLWSVYRAMDLSQLAQDPETLAVVDLDMCLDRAGSLLLQPGPTPEKLQEAHRLLDLVQSQRPQARAAVHYWRAVAFTHARQYNRNSNKFKLARQLGRAKFYELLEVAFGAAEEILGKDAVAKLTVKDRTGSRRLKPVLKAPVEAAA